MKPIRTEKSNCLLKGGEGISDLPVTKGQLRDGLPAIESCWELSAEELDEISRTGKVYFVCVGHTHPPILLTSKSVLNI